MAYSMVNHLVMMFCVALRYDSFACTQATSGPIPTQRNGRSTQLEDVWRVLGVVNGDDVSLSQRQPEIQGLWFGPGLGRRDHDQLELLRRMGGAQRVQRLLVVFLHQDEDLQPMCGVVHLGKVLDQLDDDAGFVVDGKQNRVEGQLRLRDRESFLVRHDFERRRFLTNA